jgi:hypothetical protein
MPATRAHVAVRTEHGIDGLILAPTERGPWSALRALREGMAELRRNGRDPRTAFVLAISRAGRFVRGREARVVLFVLGYRIREAHVGSLQGNQTVPPRPGHGLEPGVDL